MASMTDIRKTWIRRYIATSSTASIDILIAAKEDKPLGEKEQFEIVWPDFENLLVHLVESRTGFCNTADPCPFNTLCNSLVKLESELSESEETERTIHLDIELSDQQSAIHQNLKTLAPFTRSFL